MFGRSLIKDYRSHVRISRMFFPGADPYTIRKVQQAIDVPTNDDMMLANFMQGMWGPQAGGVFPGMRKSGHRKYNHDVFSAMMKGWEVAGPGGAYLGLQHLLEDSLNDQITKAVGPDMATLLETMFIISTNPQHQRRQRNTRQNYNDNNNNGFWW